ncbi:hypothetical protein E3N88_45776 [Mikania micrantha]|uniref:Uncharacterized protein n=1 Tax=Mikania micrantha TaxID=192012 RepID=A0A5N6L851_9ASTR|nr:hypothetical protein E3N88_45776 [Mikania micrantha]
MHHDYALLRIWGIHMFPKCSTSQPYPMEDNYDALRRTLVNSTNSGITEEDRSQLNNSNTVITEDLSQLNKQRLTEL